MKYLDDRPAVVILETGLRLGPGKIFREDKTYLYLHEEMSDDEIQIPIYRILYVRYDGLDNRREYNE